MRAVLVALLALGCTTSDPPDPPPCPALDASPCQTPVPSYTTDVAPILDRRCNETCHAPGVGPWPLTDWGDVKDWQSIVNCSISQGTMPPPGNEAGSGDLTPDERATVLDWLACGAPNN